MGDKMLKNSLLNSFWKRSKLGRDIRAFVEMGGRDAFSFSLTYKPRHGDVPGRDLQRMIDEEVEQKGSG